MPRPGRRAELSSSRNNLEDPVRWTPGPFLWPTTCWSGHCWTRRKLKFYRLLWKDITRAHVYASKAQRMRTRWFIGQREKAKSWRPLNYSQPSMRCTSGLFWNHTFFMHVLHWWNWTYGPILFKTTKISCVKTYWENTTHLQTARWDPWRWGIALQQHTGSLQAGAHCTGTHCALPHTTGWCARSAGASALTPYSTPIQCAPAQIQSQCLLHSIWLWTWRTSAYLTSSHWVRHRIWWLLPRVSVWPSLSVSVHTPAPPCLGHSCTLADSASRKIGWQTPVNGGYTGSHCAPPDSVTCTKTLNAGRRFFLLLSRLVLMVGIGHALPAWLANCTTRIAAVWCACLVHSKATPGALHIKRQALLWADAGCTWRIGALYRHPCDLTFHSLYFK